VAVTGFPEASTPAAVTVTDLPARLAGNVAANDTAPAASATAVPSVGLYEKVTVVPGPKPVPESVTVNDPSAFWDGVEAETVAGLLYWAAATPDRANTVARATARPTMDFERTEWEFMGPPRTLTA
jgi:hypothetical protein